MGTPEYKVLGQHEYDGIILNKNITDRSLDIIKHGKFCYRPTDVIVSGYPKSGNHWLINTVSLLLAPDVEEQLQQSLWLQFLMLEAHFQREPGSPQSDYTAEPTVDVAHTMKDPRVFLSHLPASFFREAIANKSARFIIPVRNVKDVVVSWYKHQSADPGYLLHSGVSLTQFFDLFIQGRVAFGDWFDHVRGWEGASRHDNVLLVQYEQNITDHEATVRRVADFLDIKVTDDKVKKVTEQTLFTNMKANENRSVARWMDNSKGAMLRKGKVGSWKDDLTPEQSHTLDNLMITRLSGSKIHFIYD